MSRSNNTDLEYFEIPNFHFATSPPEETFPVKVAFRQWNTQNLAKNGGKGTVLIPTCYKGRVNETQNFVNGALKEYHVIVVAMLGNGESSSPSNDVPDGFFAGRGVKGLGDDGLGGLRYEDCINSQIELIKSLGIEELEAVIGFSMGGQQAYYWGTKSTLSPHPLTKRCVVICGSARTSGHNYSFLEGPIAALSQSIDYADGTYRSKGIVPLRGLRAFSRAYAAWLTSQQWFRQECWKQVGSKSLVDWLYPEIEGKESRGVDWDADDLLILARMWQLGDISTIHPSRSFDETLSSLTPKFLLMPSRTDQYFPPEDNEIEMNYLKNAIFAPIESIWGHIVGGGANPAEFKWVDNRIARFLETGE